MVAFTFFILAVMASSVYGEGGLYIGPCADEEEWTNFATDWRNEEYGREWHLQYYYQHPGTLGIKCSTITRDQYDSQVWDTKINFESGATVSFKSKTYQVRDNSVSDEPFLLTEYNKEDFPNVNKFLSRIYSRQYILTRNILGLWKCIPDAEFALRQSLAQQTGQADKPDSRFIYVRATNLAEDVKEVNPLVYSLSKQHTAIEKANGYVLDTFEGDLTKVTDANSCK